MTPLIGGLIDAGLKVLDRVLPDPTQKAAAQLELLKLQQAGEFKALEADLQLALAQTEVNKVEAASSSTFVAGWRPAIGWVGAAAMAYQFLLYTMLVWAWTWAQAEGHVPAAVKPPPMLDTEALWVILSGMLGIAGMRSWEKGKGVAR